MPDIVRLRYSGPDSMTVPVIGRAVEPGDVVELPGKVLTVDEVGDPLPGEHDAIVIEFGNPPVVRAFPLSIWAVETGKKPKTTVVDDAQDKE